MGSTDEGSRARDAVFRHMFGTDKPVVEIPPNTNSFTDYQFGKAALDPKPTEWVHPAYGLTEEQWSKLPGEGFAAKQLQAAADARRKAAQSTDIALSCVRHEEYRQALSGEPVPVGPRYPTDAPVVLRGDIDVPAPDGRKVGVAVFGLGCFEITVHWHGKTVPDFHALLRHAGFEW